jgi:RNA polymerase sigma factor (TIGR02999 family)
VAVTGLLRRAVEHDPGAADELFAAIYDELRAIARAQMSGRYQGSTLQPTALVHDAYLKLVRRGTKFTSRGHFLGYVARTMRNMLADRARTRARTRSRTPGYRTHLESVLAAYEEKSDDVGDLHEALNRFEERDPRAAQVIEMYYFAGAREPAIAQALDMNERTVRRDLVHAKAWLSAELDR